MEPSGHCFSVLAVFPETIDRIKNGVRYDCYTHETEHSVTSLAYIRRLSKATYRQYSSLKKELENRGYTLTVVK